MKRLAILLMLSVLPLTALAAQSDEGLDRVSLALCGYDDPARTSSGEAGRQWTANCLVTAIRAKDRRAIGALNPNDREGFKICANGRFCYDVLEEFAFEEGGVSDGPTSLWRMVSRAKNVVIDAEGSDTVFIVNSERWKNGTAKERRDYFRCTFSFDEKRGMWLHLYAGLCGAEGDAWALDWDDGKDYGPQP